MSVARHTAYNVAGSAIPVLVSLLTVPLYLKLIGLERYGVLSIAWLLVGYFGLFEFGLGNAISQRLAANHRASPVERGRYFASAILLAILFGLVGAMILRPVAEPALMAMRHLTPAERQEIDGGLWWLSVCVPLATLTSVFLSVLQSERRYAVLNVVLTTGTLLATLVPLGLAYAGWPRIPMLIAGVAAARGVTMLAAASVTLFRPSIVLTWPTLPQFRSMLGFGGWVTLGNGLIQGLMTLEKLVLGWRLGAAATAIYMIPYNLCTRLLLLPQSLASALFPVVAAADESEAATISDRSMDRLLGLFTVIAIAGIGGLQVFLHLWLGSEIGAQSAPVGTVILIGLWFYTGSTIALSRLQASGRPRVVAMITAAQVLPYLGLLALLIGLFGIEGAAWAWALRMAVEFALYGWALKSFRKFVVISADRVTLMLAAYAVTAVTGMLDWRRIVGIGALLALSAWIEYRRLRADKTLLTRQ